MRLPGGATRAQRMVFRLQLNDHDPTHRERELPFVVMWLPLRCGSPNKGAGGALHSREHGARVGGDLQTVHRSRDGVHERRGGRHCRYRASAPASRVAAWASTPPDTDGRADLWIASLVSSGGASAGRRVERIAATCVKSGLRWQCEQRQWLECLRGQPASILGARPRTTEISRSSSILDRLAELIDL